MNTYREPIGFAKPPEKYERKWKKIVSKFMDRDFETLQSIQRTGARGRIFAALIKQCLDTLGISHVVEPIFQHVLPATWYTEFALRNGLKLRTDESYNPDFLLGNDCWLEVTLSENTAYKKLFRYGHQADHLLVIWLDTDDGLHKQVCKSIEFPNANVISVDSYYSELLQATNGEDLMRKFQDLRKLKDQIL